jgi:hypothetical protein
MTGNKAKSFDVVEATQFAFLLATVLVLTLVPLAQVALLAWFTAASTELVVLSTVREAVLELPEALMLSIRLRAGEVMLVQTVLSTVREVVLELPEAPMLTARFLVVNA